MGYAFRATALLPLFWGVQIAFGFLYRGGVKFAGKKIAPNY